MANTKDLSREDRKKAKRTARKELKVIQASLSPADRKAIKKAEEPVGVKHYLAEKGKKKEG
jgi:hypothetical protein